MFLKSLTLKGFKSFADPATLELEPGITVVVGPNGSGKSNVVDALAWVLGAQAPKTVRSQKMDDVIFAGTNKKKALGRAEVSITIDNADQVLPIEFTEVTITRTLFRSGESDYAINGSQCRLLDIQELLSDSGVGRQQHIIVSQGRIDAVLNAQPEDRRAIIEEAAGVLKYRKRKERAERRLVATEENFTRIQDVTKEVKRQIRPLEKQADAARRFDAVTAEVAALKTYLVGRELAALKGKMETDRRHRNELGRSAVEIKSSLATLDADILSSESELSSLGASDIADVVGRARSLRTRIQGQKNVVAERRRRLEGELHVAVDEGVVSNLEAQSARLAQDIEEALTEKRELEPQLGTLEETTTGLKQEQLSFDDQWGSGVVEVSTEAAEARVELQAMKSARGRTAQQLHSVKEKLASVDRRQQEVTDRLTDLRTQNQEVSRLLPDLEVEVQRSIEAGDDAESGLASASDSRRSVEADVSRWRARADALAQALEQARSAAGIDMLADASGVLGTLLDLVAIDDGWEDATEAALGEALQGIVVENVNQAKSALAALHDGDSAGAVLALGTRVAGTGESLTSTGAAGEPQGLGALRNHVRAARPEVKPVLDALLSDAVLVDGSWEKAVDVSLDHPGRVVVTKDGDRFGPSGWRIGASGAGATGVAHEEAEAKAEESERLAIAVIERFQEAQESLGETRDAQRKAETTLQQARADQAALAAKVTSAESQNSQLATDHQALVDQIAELEGHLTSEDQQIGELESSLPDLQSQELDQKRRASELNEARNLLEERVRTVANKRTEIQVRITSIEQRVQSLSQRRNEAEGRLERLVEERERARSRRIKLERSLSVVASIDTALDDKASVVAGWVDRLAAEQQSQSEAAREVSEELSSKRERRQRSETTLVEITEKQNRLELAETESRVKLESLTEALRQDLDTEPDTAINAELPELEEGVSPEARLRTLERDLRLMGAINPLAIKEFEELTERYEFLTAQMEDVLSTRRDLNTLIRSIDEEIVGVFSSAFADVAENFKELFVVLFPGGKGQLTLTNPDDLLNCGIEIEAKPSGKNVKKLSLLSGGERSLVALAFLFAVFRSRPSPFYVMDEVEAALDDINLTRFLSLIEEFRADAQLIIVSHQKRTMEGGDVLYGVSMKPGGSSRVVSERVEGRLAG